MPKIAASEWVNQYPMTYLGGEAISADGLAAIPSQANAFSIAAETEGVYYTINSPIATVTSPGYCPATGYRFEGPIGNLEQLAIHLGSGAVAHIEYWRM